MATVNPNSDKIAPCLWFNDKGEEAARYYVSLFKNSEVTSISYYGKGAPLPEGTAMMVAFRLEGRDFRALNGGPQFSFTEAVSFMVSCDTQEEIDHYWEELSRGGSESQCGWLKDKYGLSWQVVPAELPQLLTTGDPARSSRVMNALLKMKKLDLKTLREA